MNWQEIPKFPHIHYRISMPWEYLQENIDRFTREYNLDMTPDFQRGHIWTEQQQIAFVEYALMEPQSGLEIFFNHPGWMTNFKGEMVLVDGKQRLEAARRFLNNEIPAFNILRKDYTGFDRPSKMPLDCQFYFNIARLKTRADVLKWYLDFNAGGTPHSSTEIDKVRDLLKKELHG